MINYVNAASQRYIKVFVFAELATIGHGVNQILTLIDKDAVNGVRRIQRRFVNIITMNTTDIVCVIGRLQTLKQEKKGSGAIGTALTQTTSNDSTAYKTVIGAGLL